MLIRSAKLISRTISRRAFPLCASFTSDHTPDKLPKYSENGFEVYRDLMRSEEVESLRQASNSLIRLILEREGPALRKPAPASSAADEEDYFYFSGGRQVRTK